MNLIPLTARRRTLKLLAGSAAGGWGLRPARAPAATVPVISDGVIAIRVDAQLRSQISLQRDSRAIALTGLDAGEFLRLAPTGVLDQFTLTDYRSSEVADAHGAGTQHEFTGHSTHVAKHLRLTLYARHPGMALLNVRYVNTSGTALTLAGWSTAAHRLVNGRARSRDWWCFSGASHEDRRDWVQPVGRDFSQRNFMGMNASDYGGGTPVVDVWRRDAGLAIGHVETHPLLLALPVVAARDGIHVAIESDAAITLAAGASFETPQCFLHVHQGDYFASLDRYRQLMAERGLRAPAAPAVAFEPVWCAWGYERNFTTAQVEGTLQKAKQVGFEWAVLDDGWQISEGDWKIDRSKFPRGAGDMLAFTRAVRAAGMKPRLWLSPLAVDPGTDLLHDHADMLLLNKDGAVENVTWWNAFTLCPAYAPTVGYYRDLVTRIIGDWGFAGLKLDGQHLNGVAPCYNPAHHHARPEESFEGLQDFWKALYDAALAANPEAVVELCPCGTSFAFHNMPYMNQTPASDPLSSWQVRHKGKTLKALLGSGASYAGDHVELSDRGNDFASTVGIGGVVASKFTWPVDTLHPIDALPPGGFVLTPEREIQWRKWVALYRAHMLPTGRYLGALYDIGFDKPEAHAIAKDNRLYYAFYAEQWDGPLELRGLGAGQYQVTDYVNDHPLGTVSHSANRIAARFEHSLLLEAKPL